jgi:predicted ATPase
VLSRIRIDNFASFSGFELAPPRVAVLTGGNGSGKSILWSVLARIQDLVLRDATVDDRFPRFTRTAWDTREVQRFELEFASTEGEFRYVLEVSHTQDRDRFVTRIAKETVTLDGALLYVAGDGEVQLFGDDPAPQPRTRFPFVAQRSFLSSIEPRPDNRKLQAFKACVAAMWMVSPNPLAMRSISADEDLWLSRDASNFAAWYRNVSGYRNELIEEMARALGRLWPGFRLRLAPSTPKSKELRAEMHADGRAYELLFNHLSDGQRSLIFLYALVLSVLGGEKDESKPTPFVFLDEPENYVALAEIQPWLQLLSERANARGAQVLVISHHPEVIDYLAADEALVASRPGGGPTRLDALKVDASGGQTASRAIIDAADEARNGKP